MIAARSWIPNSLTVRYRYGTGQFRWLVEAGAAWDTSPRRSFAIVLPTSIG